MLPLVAVIDVIGTEAGEVDIVVALELRGHHVHPVVGLVIVPGDQVGLPIQVAGGDGGDAAPRASLVGGFPDLGAQDIAHALIPHRLHVEVAVDVHDIRGQQGQAAVIVGVVDQLFHLPAVIEGAFDHDAPVSVHLCDNTDGTQPVTLAEGGTAEGITEDDGEFPAVTQPGHGAEITRHHAHMVGDARSEHITDEVDHQSIRDVLGPRGGGVGGSVGCAGGS